MLVPEYKYYDLEGKDPFGKVWKAYRISIDTDFGAGTYVRAHLRILEKTEPSLKRAERPMVKAFLPGKIELPWHMVTETSERSWELDQFGRKAAIFEWRITKTDDGAWLSFIAENSPIEPYFKAFLRGLSILTGKWLKPICLSIYEGDQQTTRVLSPLQELNSAKLLAPIGTQKEFADDAHLFLERFIGKAADEKEKNSCEWAHQYWHRILKVRDNDIENSSLVLSVSVEGLITKTLISKRDVDQEFIKLADEALPILVDAGLSPRVLSCVLSRLENAKNPRVQDTLRRLASEGVIREAHFKAWEKLRHSAAHGGALEDDDRVLQVHLNRFHVCLDLYYRLVFLLIGYEGRHIDYGTMGWPTCAFHLAGSSDHL